MLSTGSSQNLQVPHPHHTATRAAALYVLLGLGWIWATDLGLWICGVTSLTESVASGVKGTFFLALFGFPLYRLVRNHLINDAQRARLVEAVADSTADPIFVQDADGRFVFANMAASRCLGRPTEQVLGLTALEVCGPETAARLDEIRNAVGDEHKTGEVEIGGPDGHRYLVSVARFNQDDGISAGCVTVCHDVTAHRRDQRALEASEERYRAFADHASDAFFLQTEGGRIIDVNAHACESLEYSRDELIGSTYVLFTSLNNDEQMAPLAAAVLDGESVEFEDTHRRKDGTTFPVEVRMKRVRVGTEWVVLSTARDLTGRQESEAARRQADEQRSSILEALPIHVALLDASGTISAVNDAWRRFADANAKSQEPLGIGINYLTVCDRANGECSGESIHVAAGLRAVLSGSATEFRLEYPCHAPQEQQWFELIATPVPSGGAVVMHVNVTARHRAEQARFQQAEGLRLLSDVASRLLTDRAWPELVRDVLKRAADYLECDVALSFRFTGSDLELTHSQGLDEAARQYLARLPLGVELCGWCGETQQALYYSHLQSSEDPRAATVRALGLRCYVAFPLLAGARLLGTVSFASSGRDEFADHEREFARTVSHYLATASERLRINEELRSSEERFHAVVDQAADPIFLTDGARVVDVNKSACQSLGYSRNELIGMVPSDFDPIVSAERLDALVAAAALGQSTTFETLHRRKDGTTFPVEVRCCPLSIDGRSLGLSLVRDLTERRKAESELRESEERYRRLVEVLPVGVFVQRDQQVVYCNPAYARMVGATTPDQVFGRAVMDALHPDSRPAVLSRIAEMRTTGRAARPLEVQARRLDGTYYSAYTIAMPLADGTSPAILVVVMDVTEQERTDRLMKSLLASVGDAILTVDAKGTVWLANPATERMFGYSNTEIIGGNVNRLMPEPYHGEHDRYIADYMRTGIAKVIGIGREVVGRRKDGTEFPLELSITELRLGEERHFTGVVRDLTARKKLEEQFRQSQKMEAVGRLAGGVAHDFNNLLTVINGYADLLLMELPTGHPQRAAVAAVRDAGERAAALTSQLLAFSRKTIVSPKVFDLRDVVSQAEKLLRRLIGEDIALNVVSHGTPCQVHADPNQIDQVIMNLAINARDAMPTGGRLTLETRTIDVHKQVAAGPTPGHYVELTVTDTGCGMDDELKAKIFEPFFTTKEVGKGSGLGLATVYGIVHQTGGHIEVTSEVGHGTTFRVLLPVAEVLPLEAKASVLVPATRGTEPVLLVEDDHAVRALCTLALESQGYTVLAAPSGPKALELLRTNASAIRLMVTDVVMPEMSGRQLADAALVIAPDLKVLFISGYTDDAVFRHGVRDASDAFLQKPFTPLGLARKVREMLDAR